MPFCFISGVKTIIAGSRTIWDYSLVENAIKKSGFCITEIVDGVAAGVDSVGFAYSLVNNIPSKPFHADWGKHGKAAGPIRNREMANYADALICIHNGSSGSLHMLKVAQGRGLKIYEHRIP